MSPNAKLNEKRNVFSSGFLTLEAENKYDTSTLIMLYLNPAPIEKNFLAPLITLSLKYPNLNANESCYKYSAPTE